MMDFVRLGETIVQLLVKLLQVQCRIDLLEADHAQSELPSTRYPLTQCKAVCYRTRRLVL